MEKYEYQILIKVTNQELVMELKIIVPIYLSSVRSPQELQKHSYTLVYHYTEGIK